MTSPAMALRIAVVVLVLIGSLCGCARPKSPGRAKAATHPAAGAGDTFSGDVTTADPCANRLHDLCGSLLLYYAVNHRLPQRAEELARVGGPADATSLACPVSKQPYVYNPNGLLAPDTKSMVILYDAAASHSGRRWAISIVEPQRASDALVVKVVMLPDKFFQRPAATPPPPQREPDTIPSDSRPPP